MGRSTVHYADSDTNNILKRLHNKLRPAGTPVERVEYIIELLLLRIFEVKLKQDESFKPLRKLFEGENYRLLFSHLQSLTGDQALSELNKNFFPFYASIQSKARTVFDGNPHARIQDQLVLMEEVFANSNFTNNVKGGVLAEVIGLVNEIDEKRILKTDLLGDAIESALSETGGTKDLGLYRTPEHVRKMMVEMVDPDFEDIIFDPACGTAGFLFDAFDHVVEKAKKTRKFPSERLTNQFYRTGIAGIEYQGRIRKMAAVNMYIRGLNPHNIEQGDSLRMYDPSKDADSKTVVIANPPFGAERDQPSYPNVWEDYAKESETTILFVKLMFDLLKKEGRCAVVVSEGLMTWGQNSACALRKMLLQEANLRAIISLPQGVFVSKGGAGAKTSILYFEKGGPTDFVWYYKIENDGYSMGTNRKGIEGGQIPEMLELFKEVKKGVKPQETKNSFCIPREWIETLDPRTAEKIRNQLKEKLTETNKIKKEKLVKELDQKLSDKKISKALYDEKLWQFDNVVETQIENETAKQIERAHTHHFNLQNYRSNLSKEQINEWHKTLKHLKPKDHSKIDKKYTELKTSEPKTALAIIASLDPKNDLHLSIVRDYLKAGDPHKKDDTLSKIFKLIQETRKYEFVRLNELLTPKKIKETIKDDRIYKQITVKLWGKGVYLRQEISGRDIATKNQFKVEPNDFILSKIDVRNGAFGLVPRDLDNAIASQDFPVFKINTSLAVPEFLSYIMNNHLFFDEINSFKRGATGRKRVKVAEILEIKIPLPDLKIQNEIVDRIKSQKKIAAAINVLEGSWQIDDDVYFEKYDLKRLGDYIKEVTIRNKETLELPVFLISKNRGLMLSEEYFSDRVVKKVYSDDLRNYKIIKKNQFAYSGIHANEGAIDFLKNFEIGLLSPIYRIFEVQLNQINLDYLKLILKSKKALDYYNQNTLGAIDRRTNLDFGYFSNFLIPIPPKEIQDGIADQMNNILRALESIIVLRSEAEKRIESILSEVWGEKEKDI